MSELGWPESITAIVRATSVSLGVVGRYRNQQLRQLEDARHLADCSRVTFVITKPSFTSDSELGKRRWLYDLHYCTSQPYKIYIANSKNVICIWKAVFGLFKLKPHSDNHIASKEDQWMTAQKLQLHSFSAELYLCSRNLHCQQVNNTKLLLLWEWFNYRAPTDFITL